MAFFGKDRPSRVKSRSCIEAFRSLLRRANDRENHVASSDTATVASIHGDSYVNNGSEERQVHYFNHASQAPLSPAVQRIGMKQIEADPWDNPNPNKIASESQSRVRNLFAAMIDDNENGRMTKDNEDGKPTSSGTRIAVFPSTAFAISLAARNIVRAHQQRRKESNEHDGRGRILVLQDQFDSAVYPWQQICDESGGKIRLDIIEHPKFDGDLANNGWTQAVLQKINANDPKDPKDQIIAASLPPLHWSDGTLLDLEAIGNICEERKIPLVIDATQAVGIMPCSVKKIRPVMLACSTHKWLRGPSGCCLAYISPDVHKEWIPLDFHGRGRDFSAGAAWDVSKNEMGPRGYPERYFNDARKFDSGGKANPVLMPMLEEAMENVATIDVMVAQAQLRERMNPLLKWAIPENGFSVQKESRAYHIIGITPLGKTPQEMIEISERLSNERGIILAVRCGGFRISPYLTTTEEDVEELIKGLEDIS